MGDHERPGNIEPQSVAGNIFAHLLATSESFENRGLVVRVDGFTCIGNMEVNDAVFDR